MSNMTLTTPYFTFIAYFVYSLTAPSVLYKRSVPDFLVLQELEGFYQNNIGKMEEKIQFKMLLIYVLDNSASLDVTFQITLVFVKYLKGSLLRQLVPAIHVFCIGNDHYTATLHFPSLHYIS